MIKPSWDIFKANFSDNPQFNFEWLCYLIFCKKFNKPHGIFRYKNQSSIETNPIEENDKVIGFQAKFYDTPLSKHKSDFINALTNAKQNYPNINVLFFYTNQEWGQAYPKRKAIKTAEKSQVQKDIEEKAEELGINIEWYCKSFFESPFVIEECKEICEYFFINGKSAVQIIKQLDQHTSNILDLINSEIITAKNTFNLERDDILQQLSDNTNQVKIISGLGGVGKTVEVKRLHQKLKNDCPFFVFKATEFKLDRLSDLLREVNVYDFVDYFEDSPKKIFVIDSAEKLLDLPNEEPVKEFIAMALKKGWQIIFTTRDNYFNDLNFYCMEIYGFNPQKIHIVELSEGELQELAEKHSFTLPHDEKLLKLLRIPLYLNEYLKSFGEERFFNYQDFKTKIWNSKIKNNKPKRELVFLELALKRVYWSSRNGHF